MMDVSYQLLDLLKQYNRDEQQILQHEKQPEYLYALSVMRENLLEWYPFRKDSSLLLIGSDYGALLGLLAGKVDDVTVIEPLDERCEVCKQRFPYSHISYVKQPYKDYQATRQFDYIVMVGCEELTDRVLVEKAKAQLAKGGTLLAALDNALSLRCFAGGYVDPLLPRLSYTQVRQWFFGGNLYYPVPDYHLPVTIYSGQRLPVKGELTHLSVAYDHKRYELLDEQAVFDRLCEEGRFQEFASSYLILWDKKGE